jgi:chromosome segregation ATPase
VDTSGEPRTWLGISPSETGDPETSLAALEERLREASAEAERLRELNEELAADLRRVSAEAGDALTARTRAERLQRERDEARRRASQERALAADDRMRALEAERLLAEAEDRAERAEGRLAELTGHLKETAERLAGYSDTLLGLLADEEAEPDQVIRVGEAEEARPEPNAVRLPAFDPRPGDRPT